MRLWRRVVTSVLAIAFMGASFAFLYWASYKREQARGRGGVLPCPDHTRVTEAMATATPGLLHCFCRQLNPALILANKRCSKWVAAKSVALTVSLLSSAAVRWASLVVASASCVAAWLRGGCTSVSFCDADALVLLLLDALLWCGQCRGVARLRRSVDASLPAAAIVSHVATCYQIVIVNASLTFIMRMLSRLEKHHSLDSEAVSFAKRLFLVQLVNTGGLVLIANANIPQVPNASGIRYSDFESEW
jgi:hypothetical protein